MISKMIALTLSASLAFADAGMAPVGAVTLSHMGEFHNSKGEGATASYKGHTTAIGFTKCGSGGSVYSKHTFTGTKKITFDFAGKEGGFMGYSAGFPGAHVWPIATQAYGNQHVRLETTGEWKTYTDTWTCAYTQCHIMLEDWVGSGGSCGNVYFDNFVISDPNAPEEKPVTSPSPSPNDPAEPYQNDGVTDTERAAVMKKEAAVATADKKDDTAAREVARQAAARTDEDMQAQGAAFSANKDDDDAKLSTSNTYGQGAAAVTGKVALDALEARKLARAASDAKDDAADAKRVSDERGPGGAAGLATRMYRHAHVPPPICASCAPHGCRFLRI